MSIGLDRHVDTSRVSHPPFPAPRPIQIVRLQSDLRRRHPIVNDRGGVAASPRSPYLRPQLEPCYLAA